MVLWRLLTSVYPFLRTFYISFFDNSPVRRTFDFVGLDNYMALTRDANVDATLTFTLFFTVTSVALQVVLGLAIAELLNQRFKMRNFTRAVNLLPWAMAPIVIATAARWIFHQDYGLINDIIWRLSGERPALARQLHHRPLRRNHHRRLEKHRLPRRHLSQRPPGHPS